MIINIYKLLSFQILYLRLYFNLLDTHIAQCYYHLFLILNLYNIFLVMLNYYITVCLLYKYLTFFGIVICSERNVLMSISPLQFSLLYNSSYHYWFTSIINFISGMHFISRHHHINKYDVTNHTRSFYSMGYSLTDPLTTDYFFKHRQSVIATCMPVSVTYNNEFPYSNMTDYSLSEELSPENHAQGGQTTALDIVLDTDHLDYSVLGNVDPDLNILLDNNSINCRYFTEIEFNNNFFIDTNFSLFNLNI